jgi:hypothetical protein
MSALLRVRMDNQAFEKLLKDVEQSTEKANAIKAMYRNISETITFLQHRNKVRYSQKDLFNLVYSGELTPYFPYEGVLIRVDSLDDIFQNAFRGLAKLDGYITPSHHSRLMKRQM